MSKMTRAELDQPLSDDDYDLLAAMLARVKAGRIPNVEALDGFLTSLVVCPELVRPSEFVPAILSGETEEGDFVFESTNEAEKFYGLLMRYWNEINRTFGSGDIHMPYLAEDEDGHVRGNDWAKGFLAGTHLRYDAWVDVVNDEERSGPFVPIWALAYEHADDPSPRPFDEPITHEKREELIAGMIGGAKRLFDMFREGRQRDVRNTTRTPSSGEKVGRNDPCPCGSGRKFKKCCGQVTCH